MQHLRQSQPLNRPLKKFFLIFVILFLLLSTSGCIHIDMGNPFKTPEPKPANFQVVTKQGFPISYTFDIFKDPDLKHSKTQPFWVKKDTEWVNVSIEIVLNNYDLINNSFLNSSILERYVHVTITGPKGLYLDQKFTESEKLLRPVNPPTNGKWIVAVDAKGTGYEDIHDFFEINVVAYEPS